MSSIKMHWAVKELQAKVVTLEERIEALEAAATAPVVTAAAKKAPTKKAS